MLKTVRAVAVLLVLLIALPTVSLAADNDNSKRYGVEFQLGGSYYALADVNDFIPSASMAAVSPDEIHIGTQLGISLLYRSVKYFGWQIGYNKLFAGVPLVFEHKFEMRRQIPGASTESVVEQKVAGSEWYVLATWYGRWGSSKEIMLGFGPALYTASLDRSVILYDPNANASGFEDAEGKAFGVMAVVGIEVPIGQRTGLSVQAGTRYAKVGRVKYEDPTTDDPNNFTKVKLNSYSNAYLPVDFSGAFGRITIRTYFDADSGWRTPQR